MLAHSLKATFLFNSHKIFPYHKLYPLFNTNNYDKGYKKEWKCNAVTKMSFRSREL